jgi:hypothetical protein
MDEKKTKQVELISKNEFIYLGTGPTATRNDGLPGWNMQSSLYAKCISCDYFMSLKDNEDDRC